MQTPASDQLKKAITQLIEGHSLSMPMMQDTMLDIMHGHALDTQIASLLVALRCRGETVDELEGAVRAMRSMMTPVTITAQQAIDIVGTGGDGAHTFNISTASAFVASVAGLPVAKHGNRSVSSKSGSADVLEAAGVHLALSPEQVARCIDELGIGFMFAVNHHPAMRFAAPARAALGIRSLFNLMGPLTNPASVKHHLIGTFSAQWCTPMAEVLRRLDSQRALVVHSHSGLDELSIDGPNYATELCDGELRSFELCAEDVGLITQPIDAIRVENPQQSLSLLKDALGGAKTSAGQCAANMIALNAGAALYVGGMCLTIKQGVELAEDIIYGKRALEKLAMLAEFTQTIADAS